MNRGDGGSGPGVVAESSGIFTVSGTHAYTATGTYSPIATIQDVDSTATATGSVVVSTVSATAQPVSASTGVSGDFTPVSFTDSGTGPDTAVIDWGDGTTPTDGVVESSDGSFTVSGSHTYAAAGDYVATVTITTADGETSVTAAPVAVTDGPLTAAGADLSAAQGVDTGGVVVATFTAADPNATASDFGATIDWGDGSDPSMFNAITQSGDTFSVIGDYTYLTQGTFTTTVTITDAGGATATATATATVGAGPIDATAASVNGTEGNALSDVAVATFTGDASSATIDWGDGSAPTAGTVGDGAVYGSHTYAETGTYTVNVTLTDAGGYTTTAASTANVADAALTAGTVSVTGAVEGQGFSGTVATFTDANPNAAASDFTATIDWGDGQVTAGTVSAASGGFSVGGGKTFYEARSFPVAVTVTDQDGASVVVSGTATVADAVISGSVIYLGATQGVAVNGAPLATFADACADGSVSDYTATIDWGDGTTTAGVVEGSDGTYGVRGSHTYAAAGSYTLQVTLSDAGGSATVGGTASVAATPVYTVGNLYASGGSSSDYAATIDWGDGTEPTDGVIVDNGYGNYAITGSHAYAEEGNYNVTVAVAQAGGATATLYSTATVIATALTAGAPPQAAAPLPLPLGLVQVEQFRGGGQELVADDASGETFARNWKAPSLLVVDATTQAKYEPPFAFVSGTTMSLEDVEFLFPGWNTPAIEAVGTVSGPGIPKGMTFTVPLEQHWKGLYVASDGNVLASEAFDARSPEA